MSNDPVFQYQMAFIDWQKYSGPFRKLQEYPDNWANCVFTMCGDFTQKDLLRAVPQHGPWAAINEIRNARHLAEAKSRGQHVDTASVARLKTQCDTFTAWAQSYFANETPPWQRGARESTSTTSSGCGGCALVLLGLLVVGLVIAYFSH